MSLFQEIFYPIWLVFKTSKSSNYLIAVLDADNVEACVNIDAPEVGVQKFPAHETPYTNPPVCPSGIHTKDFFWRILYTYAYFLNIL